ncbi:MAG TPA: hypothetical protein VMU34_21120, partial [Mycobacterium sp.]|nr:hypothetical protein [Mycobacterium sp.]
ASDDWTIAAEFGHLKSVEELNAVHLEELMLLREQYPAEDDATTLTDKAIAGLLDGAITAALVLVGFRSGVDMAGRFRFWFVTPKFPAEQLADTRESHRRIIELAEELIFGAEDREDGMAAALAEGDPDVLDFAVFGSAPEEERSTPDWWEDLGWESYDQWRAGHRQRGVGL